MRDKIFKAGLLTPYSKMDGLYFDDSMEPDDSIFDLKRAIEKVAVQKEVSFIKIQFDKKEDYYDAMNLLRNFNDQHIHAYSSSREDDLSIVLESDADLDTREKNDEKKKNISKEKE